MALKEFNGAAPATRLAGALAVGTTSSFSVITGGGAGYPTGATAPFVVVIDRGTALEEKILVTTRASDVFSTLTRAYDGTTAQAHSAQAVVEHVLDAATITEANAHVNTTARDDHTQYLNTARHAATAHTGAMIQDLAVATADLADGAVTTAKVTDANITYAKLEVGQRWEPGDIKTSFRATPTAGWLLCDGSLVSTTTYAALFAAIAHTANGGADPGGGNFKLPDLRQRFPMGKAASGTGSTLGATGGSKDAIAVSHGHTVADGGHNHAQNSHGHSDAGHGHGVTDPQHRHGTNGDTGNRFIISHGAGVDHVNSSGTGGTNTPVTVSTIDNASTGVSVNSGNANINGSTATNIAAATGVTVNTGGVSGTDANLPGYQVVNYFIKT